MSGLIVQAGASFVGRQNLPELPTPEATKTHVPIPHATLVESVLESLAYRRLEVVRDEYAVTSDGMRLFGFMEVNIEQNGVRLGIALRNSHDKTFSLGIIAGYRVMCCSNLAFRGEFTALARKHTKHVNLSEVIGVGVDRTQRHFDKMMGEIDAWRGFELSDVRAKAVIFDGLVMGAIDAPKHFADDVAGEYFNPRHEEFVPRTLWALSNAFTEVFKKLEPVRRMEATASLAHFLETVH